MAVGNIILVVASLAFALVVLSPRLLSWRGWRATVTPLASIIGSGFLVAGPILSHAAGRLAWLAILGLCAIGYFYGSVIRHNIEFVEPRLNKHPPRVVWFIEEVSDLALALAYFVSVAYYLNLFSAFALRGGNVVDAFWIKVVATVVIGAIGTLGVARGLGALEKVEMLAVGIKLALIGGLCWRGSVQVGYPWSDHSGNCRTVRTFGNSTPRLDVCLFSPDLSDLLAVWFHCRHLGRWL